MTTKLNADFSQPVLLHSEKLEWQVSPMAGVERRMLDRVGDEVARATSIVRYAPKSHFAPHTHGGGEEFLVLEGVFQDEHGDYPAGTYIRNPPGTRHTPGSESGCTIFVKLWQFDPADRAPVCLETAKLKPAPGESVVLFEDERECVRLDCWAANTEFTLSAPGGLELLMLEGGASADGQALEQFSWLRVPLNSNLLIKTGSQGASAWLKTGHLRWVNDFAIQ